MDGEGEEEGREKRENATGVPNLSIYDFNIEETR